MASLLLVLSALIVSLSNGAPNILLMLIDDLGWNDVSFHGGCDFPTPNIDALQKEALTLNNYYTQHLCSPTRSTIMTGLYPIHTGLQHYVIRPPDAFGLPLNLTTLPDALKKVGYQTHILGKWHLGFFNEQYTPLHRGFDSFFGYYLGQETYFWHNRSDGDGIAPGDPWNRGFDFRNGSEPTFINNTYSTYIYGNMTIDFLEGFASNDDTDKSPFFLYLPMQSVHAPLEAPQNVIDSFSNSIPNYNRSVKAAMVTMLDDVIGDIVDTLKRLHLWDDLLLIWSTDNGGPVYPNEAASNWPLRGGKVTLWEGGVRGAAFVTGGWLIADSRGEVSEALMHSVDWFPTILDIAGIKLEDIQFIHNRFRSLDGMSMKNVFQRNADSPRMEILHNIDPLNCTLELCGAIRYGDWKLVVGTEVEYPDCVSGWCYTWDIHDGTAFNDTTVQCGSARPPKWDMKGCPHNGEPCLFNIAKDPCEYHDVRADNRAVADMLYERLKYYNSTMVLPLNIHNPAEAALANPAKHGGFWGPWRDSPFQNMTNVL